MSHNVCLKNCISHHNTYHGIFAHGKGVTDVHGDATAIHSNAYHGIKASNSSKVVLHLPSHHNTFYNNGDEDRKTHTGATITNV